MAEFRPRATSAVNTRWVEVWIINDADHYPYAQDAARVGARELEDYVRGVLRTAPKPTTAWYVAQEMSANDYDTVDWQEISDTLLDE